MKVMITGAAGFVGTHLAKLFLKNQECSSLILYDKMTYAADVENILSILPDRTVKLVVGDLCDDRSLLAALDGVDTVINAAAESHVDNSFGNSLVFTKTNTLGTHTLLDCCREAKVAHLVHISTDEVFGENSAH
jgi:dTDP-D-glucose 4,6-dehydratase